ncbi:MAG TPA: putative glycolipid-binding domain-containing protein [Longimicrobium sp.]|nr:putative glycolipid-binding domain-containing protein [Longimicrobium sp.]
MSGDAKILWRRVDTPGHDAARLSPSSDGWTLAGTAVFAHEGQPCRLDYRVVIDPAWRTLSAEVKGWVGDEDVELSIEADSAGGWRLNGAECPAVEGCIDVDLNFSPSTNLLSIRRLALDVDAEAGVRVAWLRFPGFTLEPLPQLYRRTGERTYHYDSDGGAFVRELTVDATGFVTRYPDLFEAEAPD